MGTVANRRLRTFWRWAWTIALGISSLVAHAQTSGPPAVVPDILVLAEQVAEEQWPVALGTVHPPKELKQVEPGQCIRFGVVANGDGRDQLLKQAKFAFEFSLSGSTQTFPSAPPQAVKLTTPFMMDFLADTLFKNQVPKQLPSEEALAVSAQAARWCAPADVHDGTATLQGVVTLADGKTVELKRRKIEIKTFETARKKSPFKKLPDMNEWTMHYHDAPDPAQLLPALRMVANDKEARDMPNSTMFFVAAFKASPAAAEELMRRLPTEDYWTRLIGTATLGWAGYPTGPLRASFDEHDKALLDSVHLPDAFDLTPNIEIGSRQDMLWAIFFATGHIEPVRTIASELAWSEDYAKLMEHGRQVRASGQKPSDEWPDYAGRAVAYGAAGWSIGSISSRDALLDDYIEALKASPDTPTAVKKELANLLTNPAFKIDRGAKEAK